MPLTPHSALAKDRRNAHAGAPAMQHRHYAFIASIFNELGPSERNIWAVEHFADQFANTNPKFDRKRFVSAATENW